MTELVGVQRVAEVLNLKPDHVRHLARENKLPCYKVGGVYRFDISEVLAFVRREAK